VNRLPHSPAAPGGAEAACDDRIALLGWNTPAGPHSPTATQPTTEPADPHASRPGIS
jgi:hypothetical protein